MIIEVIKISKSEIKVFELDKKACAGFNSLNLVYKYMYTNRLINCIQRFNFF